MTRAALIALFVFLAACDDCKVDVDCQDGETCVKGKCTAPDAPSSDGTDSTTTSTGNLLPTDTGTATHPVVDTNTPPVGADTDTGTATVEDTDTDTASFGGAATDTVAPTCVNPVADCPSPTSCESYACVEGRCFLTLLNDTPCGASEGASVCVASTCVNGVCESSALSGIACESDDNLCTNDICTVGVCEHRPHQSGEVCADDGNPCTTDVCEQGVCGVPLNGVSCVSDNNPCTLEICNSGLCTPYAMAEGTPCDDGIWCNGSVDKCEGTTCTPISGSEPCAVAGKCLDSTCQEPGDGETEGGCTESLLTGTSCDDGLFCTGEEVCDNGACTHVNIPCTGGIAECTVEVCNEEMGGCEEQNVPIGDPCQTQDGLLCNGTERCEEGVCVPGYPYCPVFADCTQNICYEGVPGEDPTCEGVEPTDDGLPCDSTNPCDGSGTRICIDGMCADGETPACAPVEQDGNLCTHFAICVEENFEPDCILEQNNHSDFLEILCGETIAFDTVQRNNEITTYAGTACPGNLSGGEIVLELGELDVVYEATLTVEKTTMPDKDLKIMIVTNPCDGVNTCTMMSTTSVNGANASVAENTHSIVIDGEDGNRGKGTVTLTCQ